MNTPSTPSSPPTPPRSQVCGVQDFSMKDLLAPEPKRVRRHLSAVINFAKFREERLVMYAELAVKVRAWDTVLYILFWCRWMCMCVRRRPLNDSRAQ